MAGDWIKFEVATLDKPEVRQMARVLGVKHGEALELLLRFWAWIDANSVDGHVDGLVDKDVDELMRCPGFSGVMQMVGWLRCDNAAQRIEIPNAHRHTTKSAKNRALSNERQRKWRAFVDADVDADVDAADVTKPSTREEKRRVTTKDARPPLRGASGDESCDPKKRMFDLGVSLLVSNGRTSESGARSLLAKLAKEVGDGTVAEKLGYLAAHPKVEPRSYLVESCRVKTPQEVVNEKMRYMP